MNQTIKAYFFSPSGFKNYLEKGFPGWTFVFLVYILFIAALVFVTTSSLKIGVYSFLQPLIFLAVVIVLSSIFALSVGAEEPIIRALRLVAICLPPTGLAWFFLAMKSPFVLFMIYPVILYVYGSVFLGPKNKILNAAIGTIVIVMTISITLVVSFLTVRWFGYKLTIDQLRLELNAIKDYTDDEIEIYRLLIMGTPEIGHIPQIDEIVNMAGEDMMLVREALYQLDLNGDIMMTTDGQVRFAYPWAEFDNGYRVSIELDPDSLSGPFYVSDALHALVISSLFDNARTRIYSRFEDTGDSLYIEVEGNEVLYTNHPEAITYRGGSFSDIDFYSSAKGAKAKHVGNFDATRMLRLDSALKLADRIANDIKIKWAD